MYWILNCEYETNTEAGFKIPKQDGLFITASKHNHARRLPTYCGAPYPDYKGLHWHLKTGSFPLNLEADCSCGGSEGCSASHCSWNHLIAHWARQARKTMQTVEDSRRGRVWVKGGKGRQEERNSRSSSDSELPKSNDKLSVQPR